MALHKSNLESSFHETSKSKTLSNRSWAVMISFKPVKLVFHQAFHPVSSCLVKDNHRNMKAVAYCQRTSNFKLKTGLDPPDFKLTMVVTSMVSIFNLLPV
jgi:hypothetical protein